MTQGSDSGTPTDAGTDALGDAASDATPLVNGCSLGTAMDMKSMNSVTLTWDFPHAKCVIVSPGTTVTWNGTFADHPLDGGVSPTEDPTSPIQASSGTTFQVVLSDVADYPYFCGIHTGSMRGVVYVRN